ncbi:MAG: GH3 auxin-responsive promoter family protein [Flavobacteriales bacterium]|nr:GH3 auxin-responsive promoter family protein [Flavobacteriales bacterium]
MLNFLVNRFLDRRIYRIEEHYQNPGKKTEETFRTLIRYGKQTQYGKKHGFSKIFNYTQFASQTPINDYETLKGDILRMMQGEQNLLWPTKINWFAKTSGTAEDKSKFIPVSKEALVNCHYRAGKDILTMYRMLRPESSLFKGKGLILGGSHSIHDINKDCRYGDLSAILIQNISPFANHFRVPSKQTALLGIWEEKLERLMQETLNKNITNLSGVPSWMLVLMNKMLEHTGKQNIHEIWPDLRLFIHGAVSFEPYREQFKKLFPHPDMMYLETYNASEGFFGIQDLPGNNDMLLFLDYGIFYEFVPAEEAENPTKVIPLEEVEIGRNYAMIISTNSGLWRYMIGDTIKFTSKAPYRIRITGRTKHFINAFGEELMIENADKALHEACLQTGAAIREYTAAPVYMDNQMGGAHEWLIEFEKEPQSLELFGLVLDSTLKKLNSDYEAKRTGDYTLRMPQIHILPKGTFDQWLKAKNKLGGQHKVPRLSNSRTYVEEIIHISGIMY